MHPYKISAVNGMIGEISIKHSKHWTMANEECGPSGEMMDHLGLSGGDVVSEGIRMNIVSARRGRREFRGIE
jgi:hypothetical protein